MAENTKNVTEKLDYKEADTFLFNSVSDMAMTQMKIAKEMLILQKQCEEICIGGNQPQNLNIDSEQIRELLMDMIKQNV